VIDRQDEIVTCPREQHRDTAEGGIW